MRAARGVQSTRFATQKRSMCCTFFKRNRSAALPRHGRSLTSSNSAWQRPGGCTEKGRTDMNRKVKSPARNPIQALRSSGNVFADLGLPNPEQELLKARLALEIYRLIRKRGLTQTEAGKILGIKQPHVSALMRNRAGSFSVERLMEFLTALGQDVEITVRPTRKQ